MSEPKRSWRFRGGAPGPRGNRTDGRGFDENSSNGRGGRGGFRGGRGGGSGGFGKRNRDDDNHDGDGEVRERDFKARRGAWNASEQQRPPRERAEDEEKVRKNKMVLLVAYKGTGYQGLQINPGAKTLEGDIEEAIYKAGFLSEDNHNDLSKVKWSRAARTDKGVHAAGNIISLKMSVPDEHLMPAAALAEYRAAEVDTRAQLKALVERAKATQTAEFVQLVKEFEEKEVALAAAAPAAGAAAEGEADASADIPVAAPVAPGEVVYVDATPVRVASRTPDVAAIVSEVAKLKEQLSQRHSTLVDEGYASGCISSGVNAHLPAQIRVLRAERVANAFDAKLNATSRTYEYILPSFAFLPVDKYPEGLHKAMLSAVPPLSGAAESAPVAEAEGSADAGAAADAAAAAAAAGQAAAGERVPVAKSGLESVATQTLLKVLRKMDTEEKEEKDTPDAFSGPAGAVQAGRGKGKGKEKATEEGDAESEVSENDADADNANANVSDLAAMVRASLAELGIPECPPELLNYRMTPEDRARVDGILSAFIGTKNHHNLTKGRSPSDPSCMRYIDSFVTTGLFYMNGVEFVHLVVHGQSFMLHQIRKMVGYSVALARGTLAPEAVDTVFTKQRVRVPMAPALGLLLDRIHFKGYDLKTLEAAERARARGRLGDVRGTLDSMYAAVAAERTAFKEQNIYAEICARELALQSCWTWLHWANDIGYWGKTFTAEDEGPPVRRSGHAAARQLKQHAAAAQQVSAVEDQGKEGIEYVNVVKDTTAMLPSYAKAAEEEAGEAAKDQVQ